MLDIPNRLCIVTNTQATTHMITFNEKEIIKHLQTAKEMFENGFTTAESITFECEGGGFAKITRKGEIFFLRPEEQAAILAEGK